VGDQLQDGQFFFRVADGSDLAEYPDIVVALAGESVIPCFPSGVGTVYAGA
jgi:hypothetical protein